MTTQVKKELVTDPRYLARLEALKKKPAVLVALTNYCNFKCVYCSTKLEKNDRRINIDRRLFETIVDQCVEAGINPAFGQTYEPFAHPDIAELIRYATDAGLHFTSNTNGSLLRPQVYDLPMSLMISLSENAGDHVYRGSGMPFDAYLRKITEFTAHRMAHDTPGTLNFQFADYYILENPSASYSKQIVSGEKICGKMRGFAKVLGLELPHADEELLAAVVGRRSVCAHKGARCSVQFLSTKIAPNTSEAFAESYEQMPEAREGYCDSCYLMTSIQADGGMAYCCCDPTAKNIVHRLAPGERLLDVWLGKEMEAVRRGFQDFAPLSEFCRKCLSPVSEHVKPNLTVQDRGLVAAILRDKGITSDLPWFEFSRE